MNGSIFDGKAREKLQARLAQLGPASQRHWGQMTLVQAVEHMANQLRIALGQLSRPPQASILHNRLVSLLVIHVLPWALPRAGRLAPFVGSADELSASVSTLADLLSTVAEQGEKASWAPHPAFGALTGRSWGILMYRHTKNPTASPRP